MFFVKVVRDIFSDTFWLPVLYCKDKGERLLSVNTRRYKFYSKQIHAAKRVRLYAGRHTHVRNMKQTFYQAIYWVCILF